MTKRVMTDNTDETDGMIQQEKSSKLHQIDLT